MISFFQKSYLKKISFFAGAFFLCFGHEAKATSSDPNPFQDLFPVITPSFKDNVSPMFQEHLTRYQEVLVFLGQRAPKKFFPLKPFVTTYEPLAPYLKTLEAVLQKTIYEGDDFMNGQGDIYDNRLSLAKRLRTAIINLTHAYQPDEEALLTFKKSLKDLDKECHTAYIFELKRFLVYGFREPSENDLGPVSQQGLEVLEILDGLMQERAQKYQTVGPEDKKNAPAQRCYSAP